MTFVKKIMSAVSKPTSQFPLLEIAKIISDNDIAVIKEITGCIANIKEYNFTHHEQFEECGSCGFDKSDEIRWLALVEVLENKHYVCERDWKDEKSDFVYFLHKLAGMSRYGLEIQADWLKADGSIVEWCDILDKKWKDKKVHMAAIDIGGDCYVLFPCKTFELRKLKKLASQLGQRIDLAKK